ncbi:MAG: NAD(P)-binding protein [Bdellovibrionales bacterium]|nr:NAD(P)-binding protein [Bdellovibrionales bacterium]
MTKTSDATHVVGAGVAGVVAAALLLKQGKDVVLVDAKGHAGGHLSREDRQGFRLGAGFSFGDGQAFRAVADRLGLSLEMRPIENGGALQHSPRGWTPAGDLPAWEGWYARECREFPTGGYAGFLGAVMEFCESHSGFRFVPSSPVTGIQIDSGRISRVGLGASVDVEPEALYWAGPYRPLLELLQGPGAPEAGPGRVAFLKKFVKTDFQPAVALEFAHGHGVAEFTETLLLPFQAAEREERRYLAGCFSSNRDPSLAPSGKQLSSWILPLTEAEWGDNHETMKKIRAARRLLEKAFTGFEGHILFDRVVVHDVSVWPLQKKKGDWHPVLPNFSLVSEWASPYGSTPEGAIQLLLEKF